MTKKQKYMKAWGKSHAEERKEYMRKWHKDHPEHHKAWNAWNKAHPERHKAWCKANPEKRRAAASKWCKANPEKLSANAANAIAKLFGLTERITGTELKALYKKYGNRCLCCHKKCKLTPDHVIPFSKGGRNHISNIQPLCRFCNNSKHSKCTDFRNTAAIAA
jgi:hypothetical protein